MAENREEVKEIPEESSVHSLYENIRQVLLKARKTVIRSVNAAMIGAYFEVGRLIVEEELHGRSRAEYGKQTLEQLSKRLQEEFGRGFSRPNLQNMKQFYLAFRNCQTLSNKLSWSHYLLLTRVEDELGWSHNSEAGELEKRIAENVVMIQERKL